MDAERFDDLLRAVASRGSRRTIVAALAGGWLVALPLVLGIAPTEARKRKRKRRKQPLVCVCGARVCGPNNCGTGSCGSCGDCKNCEGGACFNKANGSACQGVCKECQNGVCSNKANGLGCGDNKTCQGGECVCSPSNRICGDICCPAGNVCLNSESKTCVSAGGSCANDADFCVDGTGGEKCGSTDECFCYQTVTGESRCGTQIVNNGQCTCADDDACIASFGTGAFCVRDASGNFCAGCSATGNGFCAVACTT
jgi:hypothetical protein